MYKSRRGVKYMLSLIQWGHDIILTKSKKSGIWIQWTMELGNVDVWYWVFLYDRY